MILKTNDETHYGVTKRLYVALTELKDYDKDILIKFNQLGEYEQIEKIFPDDIVEIIDDCFVKKDSEGSVYTIIDCGMFNYIEVLTMIG